MKNIHLYLILLLFGLFTGSCAFHSGMMTGNAQLGNEEFHVLSSARGTARTQHIFGIGGLNKYGLVDAARQSLYKNYPLKSNQVYANVSVDFKRTMVFFVFTTRAIVTADVVQYGKLSAEDSLRYYGSTAPMDGGVYNLKASGADAAKLFPVGKTVAIWNKKSADFTEVRIVQPYGTNSYLVEYPGRPELNKFKVKEKKLYVIDPNQTVPGTNYHVHEKVQFRPSMNSAYQQGVIAGLARDAALIRSGKIYFVIRYDRISKFFGE